MDWYVSGRGGDEFNLCTTGSGFAYETQFTWTASAIGVTPTELELFVRAAPEDEFGSAAVQATLTMTAEYTNFVPEPPASLLLGSLTRRRR